MTDRSMEPRADPGLPVNLISTCASRTEVRGPGKVFRNLVKGLESVGQPYVVNRGLDSTPRLWVHDDPRALLELPRKGVASLLGPNIVVLPRDLPTSRPLPNSIYLQPSGWVVDLWHAEGFDQCPLRPWPVGIALEEIVPRTRPDSKAPVLVYFKKRRGDDLARLTGFLSRLKQPYALITYGSYSEREYYERLHECSFVIWLGCHESQGIALQEALAADVPVLVIDSVSLFDQHPEPGRPLPPRLSSFRTTAAPYFDERCGVIVESPDGVEEGIARMRGGLSAFRPREFVEENLSLDKQALEFLRCFEELECCPRECDQGRIIGYVPSLLTRLRIRALGAARRVRSG